MEKLGHSSVEIAFLIEMVGVSSVNISLLRLIHAGRLGQTQGKQVLRFGEEDVKLVGGG